MNMRLEHSTTDDIRELDYIKLKERSWRVYLRGFWLGLPFLYLIGLWNGYFYLKKTGKTRWDEELGFVVRHGDVSELKMVAVILGYVISLGMVGNYNKEWLHQASAQLQAPYATDAAVPYVIDIPVPTEEAAPAPAAEQPQLTSKPSLDSKGWTQESTGSSEVGPPWLDDSPPGTRYYRDANRTIYRVYPPGVRPNAESANIFGLDSSTEYVPQ